MKDNPFDIFTVEYDAGLYHIEEEVDEF